MFKIATWNVNSLRVRLPRVLQWLSVHKPDLLAVQETKMTDADFPVAELMEAGYQVTYSGQKTYNGVALISPLPMNDVVTDFPQFDDPQRRLLGATINGQVRVLNLYVPNGASVDSDKYHYKLSWLTHLHNFVSAQKKQYDRLIILGDFNIAPEDRDVHDPKAWEGSVLVSPKERAAYSALVQAADLVDVFRLFEQGSVFSWWDYRKGAFHRNLGLRIDLILASQALATKCISCKIDRDSRKGELPSDHAPVIAEFNLA